MFKVLYELVFPKKEEADPRLSLVITDDKLAFLSKYATRQSLGALVEEPRLSIQEYLDIERALWLQASAKLPLFESNFNVLLNREGAFKPLQENLLIYLLTVSSKNKDYQYYNSFIKRIIVQDFLNAALKIVAIKKIIESKNIELILWFFSSEGGLKLSPILLDLANQGLNDQIETLLNLKTANGEFLVQPQDLNYEVVIDNKKHTILEIIAVKQGLYSNIAKLLEARGAISLGGISDEISKHFLQPPATPSPVHKREEPEIKTQLLSATEAEQEIEQGKTKKTRLV